MSLHNKKDHMESVSNQSLNPSLHSWESLLFSWHSFSWFFCLLGQSYLSRPVAPVEPQIMALEHFLLDPDIAEVWLCVHWSPSHFPIILFILYSLSSYVKIKWKTHHPAQLFLALQFTDLVFQDRQLSILCFSFWGRKPKRYSVTHNVAAYFLSLLFICILLVWAFSDFSQSSHMQFCHSIFLY